ncbi:MAG TPA: FKBP-type peptidyl-prolyl cis-trans isomerase [Steroidobacteraceae bacterium]
MLAAGALLAAATIAQAQDAPAAHPKAGGTGTAKAGANVKSQGSYSIGVSMGEQLHRAGFSADSLALERLTQGLHDALAGKATMSQQDQVRITTLLQSVRSGLAEKNHAAAKAFLAENGKKKDIVTTSTGLQYHVIAEGSGASPKPTDEVTVNYRGTLLDGTEFDSSYKRGKPATFPVRGVIPGWQQALVLMKPGAKWDVFIPPQLAYDEQSPPSIPPGSLLKFTVELIGVQPAPAAGAVPARPQVQPQK